MSTLNLVKFGNRKSETLDIIELRRCSYRWRDN